MLQNKLEKKKGTNRFGDEIEMNNITLRWNGQEYILKPGEKIDLMDHFTINKAECKMLEGRFLQKYPAGLKAIDTERVKAEDEAKRVDEAKKAIDEAKSFSEVRRIITGEKNKEIVEYGMDKIEKAATTPDKTKSTVKK